MQWNNALLIPILCLQLFSCSPSHPETKNYCANAIALISAPDSLKVVELNYHLPEDSLIASLEKQLGGEICEETYFGISLILPSIVKPISLKAKINKRCATDPQYMRIYNSFSIRINASERLLIENEPGTIDSIQSKISDFYFRGDFDPMNEANTAYFSLRWDPTIKKETIQKVIFAISTGFLDAAEIYAQRRFKISVCGLTSAQLKDMQEKFPFVLELSLAPSEIPIAPLLPAS